MNHTTNEYRVPFQKPNECPLHHETPHANHLKSHYMGAYHRRAAKRQHGNHTYPKNNTKDWKSKQNKSEKKNRCDKMVRVKSPPQGKNQFTSTIQHSQHTSPPTHPPLLTGVTLTLWTFVYVRKKLNKKKTVKTAKHELVRTNRAEVSDVPTI